MKQQIARMDKRVLAFLFLFFLLSPSFGKIKILKKIGDAIKTGVNVVKNAFGTGPNNSSANHMSNTPYDENEARKCAIYCSIAHCKNRCMQNWNCPSGNSVPTLVKGKYYEHPDLKVAHYQGYQPIKKTLYISWRGTDNGMNWVTNVLGVVKVPFDILSCGVLCLIHSGMLAGYKSNQKRLKQNTQQIMKSYSVERIVITGYSLGGAISIINALQYSQQYSIPIQVYTFGSPRLGNSKLNDYIQSRLPKLFRVVHYKDPIPHQPPVIIGINSYEQPKGQIFYQRNMVNPKYCPQRQDFSCSRFYNPGFIQKDHYQYFVWVNSPAC